jgi:hypothetical protein
MGRRRKCIKIPAGRFQWNGRRGRRRYEDNIIKMHLTEIGWAVVDRNQLAQDSPMVGCCEHGNELSGSIIGREFSFL